MEDASYERETEFAMPELITKYPDVVIQILNGSGARCAQGEPQQILTACPAERFCALPNGELCVYGLDEVGGITQISGADLQAVSWGMPANNLTIALIALALIAGLLLGALIFRNKSKERTK